MPEEEKGSGGVRGWDSLSVPPLDVSGFYDYGHTAVSDLNSLNIQATFKSGPESDTDRVF